MIKLGLSINVKIQKDLSDTNGHKNCLISVSVWDQAEGRNRASINLRREKKNKINNRYKQLESTLGQIMGIHELTLGGIWPTAIAPES